MKVFIFENLALELKIRCNFSEEAIIKYVANQYEAYLQDESGLNRRNIVDNRVHCCLYFISPYGRG